jgi:hypothetical protein
MTYFQDDDLVASAMEIGSICAKSHFGEQDVTGEIRGIKIPKNLTLLGACMV